jgi:hypothetical protein
MQCPVCGAEARDLSSGDFDGLMLECKHCGSYEIDDGALNEFLRLDFDGRVAALQKAKTFASPGTRPTISTSCL